MTKLSDIIASFVGKGSNTEASKAGKTSKSTETPARVFQEGKSSQPPKIGQTPIEKNSDGEILVTEDFQRAFTLIDSREPFIFITGRAGTGKTTFIQLLKQHLKSYAIVAPTGVAALNVGGQTIHSFFRIAPGPIDFEKIKRVKNRIGYQAMRALIIDEISMVRSDLLDAVDKMLRLNACDPEKPFGGVQIIAVGDLFQLPPVVTTEEEQAFIHGAYKSPFFFSAKCLRDVQLKSIEFSRVFRQKEEAFVELLNNTREGKQLSETLGLLNQRVAAIDNEQFDGLILTGDNDRASIINSRKLSELDSDSVTYVGTITGEFRVDKNKLPAPIELSLKSGSRVMFVKNDGQKRWVNGTIGIVTALGEKFVTVKIVDALGTREVRAEPEAWENVRFVYDPEENQLRAERVGAYLQIPLTLAWAVTIHKSQGKTFDRVHIDLSKGAFAEGQVYVALSRCRTLEGVTLEKEIRREDIQLNYDVIQFCEGMRGGQV